MRIPPDLVILDLEMAAREGPGMCELLQGAGWPADPAGGSV